MFKFLAAVPLLGQLPSVRAAALPQNVDELRVAMERLFAGAEDMHPCAFQEFETTRVGDDQAMYVYRIVPFSWRRKGGSVRELVACAWREFSAAAKGLESGTLFWRRDPYIVNEKSFDANKREWSLRFRVAIRPADWQERARGREADQRIAAFDAIASAEGSPTRGLS